MGWGIGQEEQASMTADKRSENGKWGGGGDGNLRGGGDEKWG